MTPANILLGIELLIRLTEQAQKLSTVLGTAAREGRDLTAAEIDQLKQEDAAARRKLQDLIDQA